MIDIVGQPALPALTAFQGDLNGPVGTNFFALQAAGAAVRLGLGVAHQDHPAAGALRPSHPLIRILHGEGLDGAIVRHPREFLKGKPEMAEPGSVAWAGLEDHYFAGLIIPDGGTGGTVLRVHQVIEEGRERNFLSLGLGAVGVAYQTGLDKATSVGGTLHVFAVE